MDNEKLNDYELLYMIRQKDEMALQYLIREYKEETRLVISMFLRRNYRYVDQEDFYQQALLKLLDSVLEYKQGTCSFHHFYFSTLRNHFIDILRSLNTNNERMSYYAISLDSQIEDRRGSYHLIDTIAQQTYPDTMQGRNLYHEIAQLQFELNEMERDILRLRGWGYTYQQIADELHISKKKVDNTLAKVRKKKKLPMSD